MARFDFEAFEARRVQDSKSVSPVTNENTVGKYVDFVYDYEVA